MNETPPEWDADKEHGFGTNAEGASSQEPIIETAYASPEQFNDRIQKYVRFLNNGSIDE